MDVICIRNTNKQMFKLAAAVTLLGSTQPRILSGKDYRMKAGLVCRLGLVYGKW